MNPAEELAPFSRSGDGAAPQVSSGRAKQNDKPLTRPGNPTVRELLREGTRRLRGSVIESAPQEAAWLLGRLLGVAPLELYLEENRLLAEDRAAAFFSQIDERSRGRPLQYILGEAEFFGRSFAVAPGVFIPRPETEVVVERTLETLRRFGRASGNNLRLLELGTGSGCIALTLARLLPACVVVAVEVSWKALRLARENAQKQGLAGQVRFVQGRWMEAIRGSFESIISNPPYIPSSQVDGLALEVRQEPRLSLDGGESGMRDLVHLISEAPRLLRPGGLLALECGEDQVPKLEHLSGALDWVDRISPIHDLAQRARGLLIRRKIKCR